MTNQSLTLSNSTAESVILSPKYKYLIAFAIWTFLAITFALRLYFYNYKLGNTVSFGEFLVGNLIDFYCYGIGSIVVFRLAAILPIDYKNLVSRIVFHLFASILFSSICLLLSIPLFWLSGNGDTYLTLTEAFQNSALHPILLHQGFIVYWGILLVAHAMEYYKQIRIGKMRTLELASQLSQAQLTALKMQVHPHFLFNTLNSIAALIHEDPEAADLMIARLSDFLRMTLRSSNEPMITLGEELDFLRTYLEIEKVRFQERLLVEIDVEENVLPTQVPNLILQPLVENSLRHGLAREKYVGELRIEAKMIAERIIIKVTDNGRGLPDGFQKLPRAKNGLGLTNTHARLRQVYQTDFAFSVNENPTGQGTEVSLNIPYTI